jgi:KUP system potassium uptake protein
MLMTVVVILIVVGFGSSSALASAYGVAVTGDMLITSVLTFFVIYYGWKLPLALCIAATGFFITIDLLFFSASVIKIFQGGWLPIAIALTVFTLMTTWYTGRKVLFKSLRSSSIPLDLFLQSLFLNPPVRVPGTAVFLTATPDATPHAFMHNLKHNKVLHERVVFLNVCVTNKPWVQMDSCSKVEDLGNNCFKVVIQLGFMNQPNIQLALQSCESQGLKFKSMETSFFLSREKIIAVGAIKSDMMHWRERLFATMARNAGTAVDHFNIPPNAVIELGSQVEI